MIAIVVITVINLALVFLFSLFAVTGDGRDGGITTVWLYGGGWTLIFFVIAMFSCKIGKGGRLDGIGAIFGVFICILTIPIGMQVLYLMIDRAAIAKLNQPNSPELEKLCNGVGAKYFSTPDKPVNSVAYDWFSGTDDTDFSYIKIDERGNVKDMRLQTPHSRIMELVSADSIVENSINYTEERRCFVGVNAVGECGNIHMIDNIPYEFFHATSNNKISYTREISADAVVRFNNVRVYIPGNYLRRIDATVIDRRDGKKLATIVFANDYKNLRVCGSTSPGIVDLDEFVLKAVNGQFTSWIERPAGRGVVNVHK